MAMELLSRSDEGTVVDSAGLRVVELMEGTGPPPAVGSKVYIHYKIWTKSFDRGEPVEASYFSKGSTPLGYLLGDVASAQGKLIPGIDAGVRANGGMREGGWRRLIVPAALGYGDEGRAASQTTSRQRVDPGALLYVDIHMMDAGSGRCDRIISQGFYTTTCSAAGTQRRG